MTIAPDISHALGAQLRVARAVWSWAEQQDPLVCLTFRALLARMAQAEQPLDDGGKRPRPLLDQIAFSFADVLSFRSDLSSSHRAVSAAEVERALLLLR